MGLKGEEFEKFKWKPSYLTKMVFSFLPFFSSFWWGKACGNDSFEWDIIIAQFVNLFFNISILNNLNIKNIDLN